MLMDGGKHLQISGRSILELVIYYAERKVNDPLVFRSTDAYGTRFVALLEEDVLLQGSERGGEGPAVDTFK